MTYAPNQFQLTHLLQSVLGKLGQTRSLVATGGSTTTIIDTTISADQQEDSFLGQYAFVAYDAGGAGAAPEGEFKRVSAYAADTFTLTTAAFTVGVAAGDRITMAKNTMFPLYDVIRICNDALRELGRYPREDTSLTTAANQTEYTLPIAVKGREILGVWLQGRTGDSNSNERTPVYFERIPTAPGSPDTLLIPQQIDGRTLYVRFLAEHPALVNYDDPVSEYVPRELAVSLCAFRVAEWKPNANKEILPMLQQNYLAALAANPREQFVRKVNGFPHIRSMSNRYPGDQNHA
jgi:hypothetical protein